MFDDIHGPGVCCKRGFMDYPSKEYGPFQVAPLSQQECSLPALLLHIYFQPYQIKWSPQKSSNNVRKIMEKTGINMPQPYQAWFMWSETGLFFPASFPWKMRAPTSPKLSRKRVFTSKPPGTETNLEPRTQRISERRILEFGDAKWGYFLRSYLVQKINSGTATLHPSQESQQKSPVLGGRAFSFGRKQSATNHSGVTPEVQLYKPICIQVT